MRGRAKGHGPARASVVCLLSFLLLASVSQGEESRSTAEELLDLSLEDLMQVEVTTVTRLTESRKDTPAAVTVLTQEDIRRSGATSIPEVLRQVPGVYVARLDGNKWSVTTRGFGGRFANKMLVLVDGVSIYSPIFSGTFWEVENVLLEDIERIEVVRGPGGASWGANAVNGVINIITFAAAKTPGGLLRVGGGSEERTRLGLRYTEKVSEDLSLRFSGQYMNRGNQRSLGGGEAFDWYWSGNTQLRLDWTPDGPDSITFVAKALYSELHEVYRLASPLPPYSSAYKDTSDVEHGNLMLRWKHKIEEDDEVQVQAYFDHWRNNSVVIGDERHVLDLETQRRQGFGDGHEVAYGIGVRHVWDEIESGYASFLPPTHNETTYSAFANVSLWAVPERLRFVIGARAEHNDYTGIEIEPTVRIAWTPAPKHTLWAAISRAVRVPARGETDIFLPSLAAPGLLASLNGNNDLDSESLVAYEIGYRYVPSTRLTLESTAFINDYTDLRTLEVQAPYLRLWQGWPVLNLPIEAMNNMEALSVGGSVALEYRPRDWWRLRASYAYLNVDLDLNARTIDFISDDAAGDAPRNIVSLWNSFEITKSVSLDLLTQFVDELPALRVKSYVNADFRLSWRPRDDLELALMGKNLWAPSRLEYRASLLDTLPSEIQRGVYAEVSWKF